MKFGKFLFAVLAVSLGVNTMVLAQGRSDLALEGLDQHAHMPNEVLVQFQPGASAQSKGKALGRVGAEEKKVVVSETSRGDRKGDLVLAKLPLGIGIAAAVRGLEQDANVEFAEPNWVYHHTATSNDPYYTNGSLWGMYGDSSPSKTNQYGSQAGEAWAAGNTNCKSVWVGIIDEGYMYTHEDLAANAGVNPGEIAGNGVDDDGNGYVDDVYGWDFVGNNNTVFDGTSDDHGTHVAGTIGGVGNNGKGVAGICWQVNLFSAKFLGKNGGTTDNAIQAVNYITDLKVNRGVNFVATNNSWGGGGYSQALHDAIEGAKNANILFIAAAGNGDSQGNGINIDLNPSYPASYDNDNIISVAAITSTGGITTWSNYGSTSVDIGAPGSGIYSTVPKSSKGSVISSYASYSGTSMATPHVTGAAALYAATHTGASAAEIKNGILSSAISTGSLAGKTATGGRLDATFSGGGGGGGSTDNPPVASFTYVCADLSCGFTDTSSDDKGLTDRLWDFGDNNSSIESSPTHVYASAGTYTVKLTVTDTNGAKNSKSQIIMAGTPDITLTGVGSKSKGVITVNLSWSPSGSGSVDVYRYDSVVATVANSGKYTEQLRGSGTVTYKVCVAGSTSSCSNTVSMTF